MSKIKILIIGGGPASVSTCMQIVKEYSRQSLLTGIDIHVFEKRNKIGSGLPYSEKEDCYILNLPKSIMGPMHEYNDQFSKWLKSVPDAPQDTDFPPRYYFGQYLEFISQETKKEAYFKGINVKYHVNSEVISVDYYQNKIKVIASKKEFFGDYLVLCTGHMPSSTYQKFIGLSGYYHSPWNQSLYKNIHGKENIVVIGTRLTAIDTVLKIFSSDYKGKVSMVSRGGLLPTVLSKNIPSYTLKHLTLSNFETATNSGLQNLPLEKLMELLALEINEAEGRNVIPNELILSYQDMSCNEWLKKQILEANSGPRPWQQVLFSMYPIVPKIWSMLSFEDKKKFVKNYKSTFLTYLAAFPLENAYKIESYIASGRLNVWGGVTDITQTIDQKFCVDFLEKTSICTSLLINATGPGYNISANKLYQSMVDKKIVFPNQIGGIEVDPVSLKS